MAKPPAFYKARVVVRVLNASAKKGRLQYGSLDVPCAIGRSGISAFKREGDGTSPRGAYAVRRILFNAERGRRPETIFPLSPIKMSDGWCDSSQDRNYNRMVPLPYGASHERLWRDDGLYDIVVVLGFNDRPRVRGRGSAIFMHVARSGFAPTEGCVALSYKDLRRLLARLRKPAEIVFR